MATQQTQVLGRALLTPAVALLFIWMIVPLAMTIYFSTLHYSLLDFGKLEFCRAGEFSILSHRSRFSDRIAEHAGAGRFSARHHHPARHAAGTAARSAGGRAQHRPLDGDRTVLRDADRERAGLEEPLDASGVRTVRLGRDARGRNADRLVQRCAFVRGDPDRGLAMAAVRDPHPADGAAVPGRGAEGSRRDGRGERAFDLHLSHLAASRAADHRGHPDRNDIPADRVRRDLCHDRRRPRPGDH